MVLAEHALRCSLAASLAYLSPTQLGAARKEWRHTGPFYAADPGQEYASRLAGAGLAYAEQVLEPSLAASATIFQSPDGEEACVAFRGSTSVSNFRSMFALGLVPCDLDGASGGLVHEGYQEASLRLYERLRPALDRLAAKRVVFTGHSFGGGTATLCALYHSPDELLTFSAPLVGDAAFAQSFDAILADEGREANHLVHDADPVLQQNRPLWDALGYQRAGREVRCSPTEPVLLGERAEEDSGGGSLAWNFLDHTRYLGTYMGPRVGSVKWSKLLKPNFRPRS